MSPSTPVWVHTYPAGATFGPRRMQDYEFVWILLGSATWQHYQPVQQELSLRPGQLALARPGTIDSYRWDPRQETVHAYVHFAVTDPGSLPPAETWPATRRLAQPSVLDGICQHLLDLAGQSTDDAEARTNRLLAVLLDLFVAGPVSRPEDALPPAVAAVLAHVRRGWRDGLHALSVPELAAAAGVSEGHLFRIFRTEYGCSPARALEAVRLARAATLLQRSNATLSEIAHRCGFANPYHFSRRFTAVHGVPPGAYRRVETGDPYERVRAAGLLPIASALLEGVSASR